MKTFPVLLLVWLSIFTPVFAMDTPVSAAIKPGTNQVQTLWNATPGRTYRVQVTTNLTAPWLNVLPGVGTLTVRTTYELITYPFSLLG